MPVVPVQKNRGLVQRGHYDEVNGLDLDSDQINSILFPLVEVPKLITYLVINKNSKELSFGDELMVSPMNSARIPRISHFDKVDPFSIRITNLVLRCLMVSWLWVVSGLVFGATAIVLALIEDFAAMAIALLAMVTMGMTAGLSLWARKFMSKE